jgi:hypothetical protein
MTGIFHKLPSKLSLCCRAVAIFIACALSACGTPAPKVETVQIVKPLAPTLAPLLLHLPGIGGKRSIDIAMIRGLKKGGFTGDLEIYDWTEDDAGLRSLISTVRNHKEAQLIADKITTRFDKDPLSPIYLTCHSGGGGIAIWALEDLPKRVKIQTLIMMSPALSPTYDLSAALRHVSGKAYVFSSNDDVLVLGTGCKLLGTIDGVKTQAAGMVGFKMPPTGDAGQYAKLIPEPYNPAWIQYDDYGNHVGGMTRLFGQYMLAPLILSGKLPATNTETTLGISPQVTQ